LLRLANQEKLVGQSYQKNKFEDPLALKPRPDTMAKALTTDEIALNEETGEIEDLENKNIYKAPKLAATLMDDEKKRNKTERLKVAERRKRLKSTLISEMGREIDDNPLERKRDGFVDEIEDEKDRKRREYEEENFIRLPETKKDKKRLRDQKIKNEGRVDDFSEMDNLRAIVADEFGGRAKMEKENEVKFKKTLATHFKGRGNQSSEFEGRNKKNQSSEFKGRRGQSSEFKGRRNQSSEEGRNKKKKFKKN